MRAFLMFKDRDFELERHLPNHTHELIDDLGLSVLFEAMAGDDEYLYGIVRQAVLLSLTDPQAILYRQGIFKDCLKNPGVIKDLYQITIDAVERKRKHWLGIFSRFPSGILYQAVEMVEMFAGLLRELKQIAVEHSHKFESSGFTTFFAMIEKELSDEYLETVESSLQDLKFRKGVLISAELGMGNEGANHVLRKPNPRSWWKGIFPQGDPVFLFQ